MDERMLNGGLWMLARSRLLDKGWWVLDAGWKKGGELCGSEAMHLGLRHPVCTPG